MITSIYKYTNLQNGLVYVGKTKHCLSWRHGHHLGTARTKKKRKKATRFQNALLAGQPFEKEVLVEVDGFENGCLAEMVFIAALKSNIPEYGYNLTDGGDGVIGTHSPKSPEHSAKLARHLRSVWEEKRKLGIVPSGRPKGSKTNEQGRENISRAQSERQRLIKMTPEKRRQVRAERERNRRARIKAARLNNGNGQGQ